MNLNAYLNRIGFSGTLKTDYETLCKLQTLHLQNIPYENLDIMRDIPVSLQKEDMFKKTILGRRGGYCFELNSLFSWLLQEIGFGVTNYMARFWRDEQNPPPMRRHHVLRVECTDGVFLGDVGVGGVVPRVPLEIVENKISEQNGESYKLCKEDFFGWMLYELKRGEWQKLYSFAEEPQLDLDYIMPSFYCEKYPDSFFRSMDMVHIFTKDGRKSVADREVKLFTPTGVEVIIPKDDAHYKELLELHFNIVI